MPIQTNITARLEAFIDYTNLIEKIRKDIVYPQRIEQTQEMITQAFQKGFSSPELLEFQGKLDLYKGWSKSIQLLRDAEVVTSIVDLVRGETRILANLVD